MSKIVSKEEAVKKIQTGMTVMIGGFLRTGVPKIIIDEILKHDIKDLTIISNDTSYSDSDRGKLITAKRAKKIMVSHIGTNDQTGKQMHAGELEVVLTPQGTLAEVIRAGGAGLGGILTPTGIGTLIEKGKEIKEIDGKKYILEKAVKADVALIYATKADKYGNLSYEGSTRNFNTVMATAADFVIVEADEIIDGALDPKEIIVPGVYVDYIIQGEVK